MTYWWDIVERANKGKYCTEKDWDTKVLPSILREKTKEYGITWNPEEIPPNDDGLADAVWKAGYDVALTLGMHCLDTQRIIMLEEDEIKLALKSCLGYATRGAGRDARTIRHRKIEDRMRPYVQGGLPGAPLSDDLWIPIVTSHCTEMLIDEAQDGFIETIEGVPVKAGSPTEMHACMQEAAWAREARRRAGRPGLCIVGCASQTYAGPDVGAANEAWGIRSSDARLIPTLNEGKTDYQRLQRVAHALEFGEHIIDLIDPIVGAYCGGPAETAVYSVYSHIYGLIIYRMDNSIHHPIHMLLPGTTNLECMWQSAITGQALARNSNIIQGTVNCFTAAGPCTEQNFQEILCWSLAHAPSGCNFQGVGARGNKFTDYNAGLDARWLAECGYAIATQGIKRSDAQELIKKIYPLYRDKQDPMRNAPPGKKFDECYNPKTIIPSKEYLALYGKAKKWATDLGIDMDATIICHP